MIVSLGFSHVLLFRFGKLIIANVLHRGEWSHVAEGANVPGHCIFKRVRLTLLMSKLEGIYLPMIDTRWLSHSLVWLTILVILYIFLTAIWWSILFGFTRLENVRVLINGFLEVKVLIILILILLFILAHPHGIWSHVIICTTTYQSSQPTSLIMWLKLAYAVRLIHRYQCWRGHLTRQWLGLIPEAH